MLASIEISDMKLKMLLTGLETPLRKKAQSILETAFHTHKMPETKKEIYLDHSAATYLLPEVIEVMKPYFEKLYANPSSLHSQGLKIREDIEKARKLIAKLI